MTDTLAEKFKRRLRSRGFTKIDRPDFSLYKKSLPDRTVLAYVFKVEGPFDRVFLSERPGLACFVTLDELELAITYQELRPLQFLTRPLSAPPGRKKVPLDRPLPHDL